MIKELGDYVNDLPESERESFKALVSKAIVLENREAAARALKSNQFLDAEFQSVLSKKHEEQKKALETEHLPKLLEAELEKRTKKEPWQIELEKERQERVNLERKLKVKDLKELAVKKASELGLPLEFVDDRLLGENEDETVKEIERLGGLYKTFTGSAIEKHMASVASSSSVSRPTTGQTVVNDLETQYKNAINSGNAQLAMSLKEKMAR